MRGGGMVLGPFNLGEMMGQSDDDDGFTDEKGNKPLPEAVIMSMREIQSRYGKPCPFKPGDIVTPHPGSDMKAAGTPHIVLEVKDIPPEPNLELADDERASSSGFGRRVDMRFLAFYGGRYVPFWGESWQFIPYEEKTA